MTFNLIFCGILVVVAIALETTSYRGYALITMIWAGILGILTLNGFEYARYVVFLGLPVTLGSYLFGQALSLTLESAETFMDSH